MERNHWQRKLMADRELPRHAKFTALALLHHYPVMRPGRALLAQEMGVSERHVSRGIRALEDSGWIRRAGGGSGPGRGRQGAGSAVTWELASPHKHRTPASPVLRAGLHKTSDILQTLFYGLACIKQVTPVST